MLAKHLFLSSVSKQLEDCQVTVINTRRTAVDYEGIVKVILSLMNRFKSKREATNREVGH